MLLKKGIFIDHQCKPDDFFRCKICGKLLKWVYYGNVRIYEPYQIIYYDFSYIVNEEKQDNDIMNRNFTEIKYLIKQREFALYMLNREQGYGFLDFFHQKKQQISRNLQNLCITGDEICKELEFYSDFENGNMNSVIINKNLKKAKIILKSDTNSLGFTQWFYFGVKFWGEQNSIVNFEILNSRKNKNLFQIGMPIYIGSIVQNDQDNQQLIWEKSNVKLQYKKSQFHRKNEQQTDYFYSLNFDFQFQKQGERVLFSYHKPYTFTDLVSFLENKEQYLRKQQNITEEFNLKTRSLTIQSESIFYKKEIIGGSRLGLSIFGIEISSSKKKKESLDYEKRKIIVFQGRQHPSESPSSLIIQGIIDFLLNMEDQISNKLKDLFIFKIFPMINPDGVFVGNSRTNISGFDLNKQWEDTSETLQPEIYFLKEYFRQIKKQEIFAFLDIHSSASNKNAFAFGCENQEINSNFQWVSNRVLMKIMHESMPYFNYFQCKFSVKNQECARVYFWKKLKAIFSFNFDVSFSGLKKISIFNQMRQRNQKKINLFLNWKMKSLIMMSLWNQKIKFLNKLMMKIIIKYYLIILKRKIMIMIMINHQKMKKKTKMKVLFFNIKKTKTLIIKKQKTKILQYKKMIIMKIFVFKKQKMQTQIFKIIIKMKILQIKIINTKKIKTNRIQYSLMINNIYKWDKTYALIYQNLVQCILLCKKKYQIIKQKIQFQTKKYKIQKQKKTQKIQLKKILLFFLLKNRFQEKTLLEEKELEYDTDSQPEDDLLYENRSIKLKQENMIEELTDENIQQRQLLYQQIQQKFKSDKYQEFLDVLTQNELNLLLQGKLTIDEFGNITRKKNNDDNDY
ncbi:zinc carboxypeptidase family protein, putative [Ichthyophthirius multifiliis]|uniref:Zinc carboxypeptidase family protein, putative n=1 Tax=Ichthyophthirius multifiliis TaxID=5932 RepID=G0QRL2_ICHMU|nr:zinc carboxypeptidase family protein, putative [Ichthyophthirius multifiliis]EGR32133.1 zinc carboxypeptidase family protein, putative [Ichthyophthirius multifiliis]|eukprot:XP_004035619.1 zinc carboxypeptidase family protein, putative [Ichthyophthirius multifiliis]